MPQFLIETRQKSIVRYKYAIEANTQYDAIRQFVEDCSSISYVDYEIIEDVETINLECTQRT